MNNSLFIRSCNKFFLCVSLKYRFPLAVRNCKRLFSLTPLKKSFFEYDKRSNFEYPVFSDKSWNEHFWDGVKIFSGECKLFLKEIDEKIHQDPKLYQDGDTDVFFRFNSEECLKKWRVSSDKDNKEGHSECKFIVNDKGKGVFYGTLDCTPPKDGKKRYSGYCAIKSAPKMKSFLREDFYEWSVFTHLELRVKGDGRNYFIQLGIGRFYDVGWFDTYTYIIHTHGGPYWQLVRIPFSKFFLASKGRTQDKQERIPLDKIISVGITAGTVPGPFHLEIDYIGCHTDCKHTEKFAYELYNIPKEFVST